MRIFSWIFAGLLALSVSGAEIQFNFNETTTGAPPTNFLAVLAGGGQPGDWRIITAEVPLAEMFGYATAVRSLSKGRAGYSMEPFCFLQVPTQLAADILDSASSRPAART